jgi:hypothetical protein
VTVPIGQGAFIVVRSHYESGGAGSSPQAEY